MPASSQAQTCLQCGRVAPRPGLIMCVRCGLRYGDPPPVTARRLAACPVCYRETDDDGRIASMENRLRRVDINEHIGEHEQFPVGDDGWLETLRINDRIRIGRWEAPFDLVRRYLVTGVYDAGRDRLTLHNAVIRAMSHGMKYGSLDGELVGESSEAREARVALAEVMERYHRGSVLR